jgi:hypothetical protein
LFVGVVGSRRSNEVQQQLLFARLDELLDVHGAELHVLSGGCPLGADAWAEEWCRSRGVTVTVFHPRSQTPKMFAARNSRIAAECELLLATLPPMPKFDRYAGTEQTVREARLAKKMVCCLSQDGVWL